MGNGRRSSHRLLRPVTRCRLCLSISNPLKLMAPCILETQASSLPSHWLLKGFCRSRNRPVWWFRYGRICYRVLGLYAWYYTYSAPEKPLVFVWKSAKPTVPTTCPVWTAIPPMCPHYNTHIWNRNCWRFWAYQNTWWCVGLPLCWWEYWFNWRCITIVFCFPETLRWESPSRRTISCRCYLWPCRPCRKLQSRLTRIAHNFRYTLPFFNFLFLLFRGNEFNSLHFHY